MSKEIFTLLIVLTSHDQLGDTGEKTGFWLEEFTTPYYIFLDAGAKITLASPNGGMPPIDPRSLSEDVQTDSTRRYFNDINDISHKRISNINVVSSVNVNKSVNTTINNQWFVFSGTIEIIIKIF